MPRMLATVGALLLVLPLPACHRHHRDDPSAHDQSFTVNENGSVSGSLDLSNANWDSVTFHVTTTPQNGNLSYDSIDGTFTYQPTHGYSGPDSFQWQAEDDEGTSNIATASITVQPSAITSRDRGHLIHDDGSALLATISALPTAR